PRRLAPAGDRAPVRFHLWNAAIDLRRTPRGHRTLERRADTGRLDTSARRSGRLGLECRGATRRRSRGLGADSLSLPLALHALLAAQRVGHGSVPAQYRDLARLRDDLSPEQHWDPLGDASALSRAGRVDIPRDVLPLHAVEHGTRSLRDHAGEGLLALSTRTRRPIRHLPNPAGRRSVPSDYHTGRHQRAGSRDRG